MGSEERSTSRRRRVSSSLRWCLRLVSATEVAVVLIVVLVFVLALATVMEGIQGRAAVEYFVYRSWWFKSVFLLLGINTLAALMARFPWQWHQCGFVMTHAGLLVLLLGMAQSSQSAVEGRMALQKADRSGEIELVHCSQLRIQQVDGDPHREVTFAFHDVPLEITSDAFDSHSLDNSLGLRIVELEPGASTGDFATESRGLSHVAPESSALIELEKRGDVQRIWLARNGEARTTEIDRAPLLLELSSQSLLLDFSVELLEVRQMRHAGGNREAAISGRLCFHDKQSGAVSESEIAVNQPATYRGFKFFLLDSPQLADSESEVILGVTRDPGRVIKYLGATTICLGMIFTLIVSMRTPNPTGAW